jgi:Ca2+-binding RTX toxin-like protein
VSAPTRSLGVVALVLVLLGTAAAAEAATLSRSGGEINFEASMGEVNDVTIELASVPPDLFHVFSDPGNAIDTSADDGDPNECFNFISPDLAACPAQAGDILGAFVADGGDSLASSSPFTLIGCGGEDDDQLTGGSGLDLLLGEGGTDTMDGGDGNDILNTDAALCGSAPAAPASNHVEGGAGDDIIDGGPGEDTVDGGDGDDSVCGAEGDDPITGGAGRDFLRGDAGHDTFDGGEGNDFVFTELRCNESLPAPPPSTNAVEVGAGDDTVVGGAGDDAIDGGDGNDSVCAQDGDDLLVGGEGPDLLVGEAGHDTFDGGGGNDIITAEAPCDPTAPLPQPPSENDGEGGVGDDALIGGKGVDRLGGGDGNDSLFGERVDAGAGGDADDRLVGGEGNDSLVGHDGDDALDGGDGDDELAGGNGDDELLAGAGNDVLGRTVNQSFTDSSGQLQRVTTVENGSDLLDGGAGDDVLNGSVGDAVLNFGLAGSIDASEVAAPNGPDNLIGGGGRDTVTFVNLALPVRITPDGTANDGSAGEGDNVQPDNEVMAGGSAADVLVGGAANDTLDGGKGGDSVEGAGGDDTLRGGAEDDGTDTLRGGPGADSLGGGPGGDTLDGEAGADALDGGGGADTASGGDDADRVSGGAGLDSLSGGTGDDRLRGAADGLIGADGADMLRGDDGSDDLDGGPGNDTLAGGRGPDLLAGATGRDAADYREAGGPVTANLDGLAGDGEKTEGDFIQADVEGLLGGAGRDTLIGNAEPNTIAGGGGADYLDGRGGADGLDGGDGADAIRARDGEADRVACGGSRDFTIVDGLDRIGGDCERIAEDGRQRPVLGRSIVVRPVDGSSALRLPGAERAIPLMDAMKVPVRSSLDTRAGAVRVTTARGGGGTQSGVFSEGRFGVRQRTSERAGAELRMRGGGFGDCAGDEVVRGLRGRGQGRFRMVGRTSVTTTHGTRWAVEDRCDGTLTRIRRGRASVLDLRLDRKVTLTRGESYLARAR